MAGTHHGDDLTSLGMGAVYRPDVTVPVRDPDRGVVPLGVTRPGASLVLRATAPK